MATSNFAKSVKGMYGSVPIEESDIKQALQQREFVFSTPADWVASNTALAEYPIMRVPFACVLRSAHLLVKTTIDASDTDNRTFTLAKRDGAGGGATSLATRQSNVAGGTVTAMIPTAMTLTSTASDLELAAGNILTLASTEAGTGPAWSGGSISIVLEER